MTQKTHASKSKPIKKLRTISVLISAVLCTSAYATPKTVIISLDGATQQGDASIASGDFVNAIESFKHAWQRALQR